jgi:hypothetical protein
MPIQEVFFFQELDGKQLEVIKTYDSRFAREAFEGMDESAKQVLSDSLVSEGMLEPRSSDFQDDELWEGIEEGAREDWNSFSYFVVRAGKVPSLKPVFVSSDWPTAERFAKLQGAVS